jgi:hypothetical protein
MAGVTASSMLVAFLVASVAALPSTLLEDTKQAATESEPIISKGKEEMNYHANFKFRFYFLSIRKVGTNFVSIN